MMALDTETQGIDLKLGARPFFVTMCDDQGNQTWYEWDVDPLTREVSIPPSDLDDIRRVLEVHRKWATFDQETADRHVLVGQNMKFDCLALGSVGITDLPWPAVRDTLLAAHLLTSNQPKDLTSLAIRYLGVNIEPHELALKKACDEARRMCRSKFPEWRIAKANLPEMPSAKKMTWKFDTWLPRAIVKHLWETSEAGEFYEANGQDGEPEEVCVAAAEDRPGWEYRPPEVEGGDHPWWTVLRDYANADSAVTVALWPVMWREIERRNLGAIYRERLRVLPVVARMEADGVTVSKTRLRQLRDEFGEESERAGRVCVNLAAGMGADLVLPKAGSNESLMSFCFRECAVKRLEKERAKAEEKERKAAEKAAKKTAGLRARVGPSLFDAGAMAEHGLKVARVAVDEDVGPCLDLPVLSRTDTGRPSLDKNTLDNYLASLSPRSKCWAFVNALRNKRKRDTALAYMEGYERFWVPMIGADGRIMDDFHRLFPNLNPTGTDTLRFSSSNPNEQNICFDGETELLTDQGWVKIRELPEGARIAQYWRGTGKIDFVIPEVHSPNFKGGMVHLRTQENIDLLLTPGHRCLLRNRKTRATLVVRAEHFKPDYQHLHAGYYVGGSRDMTAAEITWLCAVQADGSYHSVGGYDCGIRMIFKKARKIERLRDCLTDLGAVYTESVTKEGGTSFYIHAKDPWAKLAKELMPDKCFGPWLLELTRESLDLLVDELFFWDGDFTRKSCWSSSVKKNSDWVQTVFSLSGSRATLASRMPTSDWSTSEHYYVNVTLAKDSSMTTNFTSERVPWNGPVYCVTVPSSYVVVRRNGKVAITGNSKQEGFSLRRGFGPAPGREWWSCDAKNIEARLPAYESGEQELISLYEQPDVPPYYGSQHLLNFHTVYPDLWERELREVGLEKVGPYCKKKYASTWYQWVKNGGFAVQYGAMDRDGGGGTADRAFHKRGAHALLKQRFSRLESLNQHWIRFADRQGYVETIPDRSVDPKRGYPLLVSRSEWGKVLPTVPLNYHIQGSAMWWMARAMVRCQEQLDAWREEDGFDGRIAMQVHDELVFDFPRSEVHPSESEDRSNLWRIRVLQELMEVGGRDLVVNGRPNGIPTPTGVEYHQENWAEGVTL